MSNTREQMMDEVMAVRPHITMALDEVIEHLLEEFPRDSTKIAIQLELLDYAARMAVHHFGTSREDFGTAAREVYGETLILATNLDDVS